MKCRHPRSQRQRLNHSDWDCCYDCNICRRCGEWLSLGPAAADTPEVAIEKRAAFLAGQMAPMNGTTFGERDGWHWHRDNYWPEANSAEHVSGYLARCIATHEEP